MVVMGRKDTERFLRDIKVGMYGLLIMHALKNYGGLHGYGLRKEVEEMTGGLLKPSESTVYETLKKLEKSGILKSSWMIQESGLPRKYYRLTEAGSKVYEEVRSEVIAVIRAVLKALGEE